MIDKSKKQEKLDKLQGAISNVEKRFGKGIVFYGHNYSPVPILCSTGSVSLDTALGCFGTPQGRIIEIFGPESSGKTSMSLIMASEVQKEGGIVAFVDAEHALDPVWATRLGLNMNEVILSQPDCGEDALEIVEEYVKSGAVDFIIVDSVAALVPKAELAGNMGDSHMGLQARLMSQAMRKLTGTISKSSCTVVFINQIRMKIGVMFGSPETTTGGNALKFYATIRMDVRREDQQKDDKEGQTSVSMKVKIVKNKVATPFKIAHIPLLTGKNGKYGFDNVEEILTIGVDNGFIKKAGTWYSYGEERIGQGIENATNWLRDNPSIAEEIKMKAVEKIFAENKIEIGSFAEVTTRESEKVEEDKKKNTKRKKYIDSDTTIEEVSEGEK